jgi:hypothetical protein
VRVQKKPIRENKQRAGPLFENGCESRVEIFDSLYPRVRAPLCRAGELRPATPFPTRLETGSPGSTRRRHEKLAGALLAGAPIVSFEIGGDRREPGNVSTRVCETFNEVGPHRVSDGDHNQRGRRSRFLYRDSGGCPCGHDEFDLRGDQLRDKGRKALVLAVSPAILDDNVFPVHITEIAQSVAEGAD